MSQPDIIAPANGLRMAALHLLGTELGLPLFQVRDFLQGIGVPIIRIGAKDYVNLGALEMELWSRTASKSFEMPPTLREAVETFGTFGRLYAGLSYDATRKRLSDAMGPLKKAAARNRKGGRIARTDPRYVAPKIFQAGIPSVPEGPAPEETNPASTDSVVAGGPLNEPAGH